MSWTATGTYQGQPYTLAFDDDGSPYAPDDGSIDVLAALTSYAGQPFQVPPTGPGYVLDFAQGKTALAWLSAFTDVEQTEGDVPMTLDAALPPGAVA